MLIKNLYLLYFIKFLGAFCLLYFGTKAVIGLAAPIGHYSAFVHNYLNYPTQLRNALLYGAKMLLAICGYDSYVHNLYYITLVGGRGVRMVYSCLGIGLLSFWAAFVFANSGSFKRKLGWITGGLLVIWLINITRVALFLLATNKKLSMPFNLDNHTFFNIAAYTAILILIWLYDRSARNNLQITDARP